MTEIASCAPRQRFDAEVPGQTHETGYQFVTGIRNIVGIAWDPATQAVYAVQHGRDAVNTLWPALYNADGNAELPWCTTRDLGQ